MRFVLPGVRLAIGIVALVLAVGWRSLVLSGVRPAVLALFILVPLALVVIEARRLWVRRTEGRFVRAISWAVMVAASAALIVTSTLDALFQRDRYEVRHGQAERLERLGRHIDGLLITDDFSTGAVYAGRDGLPAASVAALNAGIDLILLAYDPDQFFRAIAALMRADGNGQLRADVLARSSQRLLRSPPGLGINH